MCIDDSASLCLLIVIDFFIPGFFYHHQGFLKHYLSCERRLPTFSTVSFPDYDIISAFPAAIFFVPYYLGILEIVLRRECCHVAEVLQRRQLSEY